MQNLDLKEESTLTPINEGLEAAAGLILKICGGKASKFMIAGKSFQKKKIIKFDVKKYENLIGIPISINEANKILLSLGFKCKKTKKLLVIEIPSWRPDIMQEVDVIEELIRIKGFNKIKLIEPIRKRKRKLLISNKSYFIYLKGLLLLKVTWRQ